MEDRPGDVQDTHLKALNLWGADKILRYIKIVQGVTERACLCSFIQGISGSRFDFMMQRS